MSIWYAIPSARPMEQAEEVLSLWRRQGYRIALFVDADQHHVREGSAECLISQSVYPGYAVAVNSLVREILRNDPAAEWIVTGGDDVEPDPNHTAAEIAAQCNVAFSVMACERWPSLALEDPKAGRTFGVMQPTGDRWGQGEPGPWPKDSAYIDRICGSPWMGREFCQRINGGRGPLREEFSHMFVDEALQEIALQYNCLWQRRDLVHHHRHWARKPGTEMSACPSFLQSVNSPGHWRESREMFNQLKSAGWPGSAPL